MTKIAFQGERGAYSEIAAKKLFGNNITISPSFSFDEVFLKVREKKVDFGVVPIENSLYGSVFETYDLLLQNSLSIVNELNLQINHFLLASKKYKLSEIKKVYSHPQALGQCSIFLKTLENADIIPAYDTAGSALITLNDTKTPTAAVASRNASELYGLKILKSNIQNNKENFTRFLVISKKGIKKKFQNPKTSMCFELKSLPGALFRALSVFALRDINLVKIESRPIPHKPFEYVFYVDLSGSMEDEKVKNAINHLSEISIKLKCFGSYEAGKTFKS
jgi:prephenate dehydratase